MSAPRLARALAASAAVHLAVLAGLVALARPRLVGPPPLRVALVEPADRGQGHAAGAGRSGAREEVGRDAPAPGTDPRRQPALTPRPPQAAGPAAAVSPPAAPSPSAAPAARRAKEQGSAADGPAAVAAAEAVAMVTPVQSDLWVLGPEGASGSGAAAPTASGGTGEGAGSAPGAGSGGVGGASLLAALSQRLAWSAQRCAPPSVVRTARHAVPGVPLRFCLDAAGRPSEVGLLGTTGSEQLDRAARDCVIPGAMPLPPVPGCYTVEVRFPTRG